jgi:hypothetical protein
MLVNGVAELLTELDRLKLDRAHAHLRYWFRGQPEAGLALKPGVYRPAFGNYKTEEDRFEVEKHLNQDFRVLFFCGSPYRTRNRRRYLFPSAALPHAD